MGPVIRHVGAIRRTGVLARSESDDFFARSSHRGQLVRREPREPEIAVVGAASQCLCPFKEDALCCIGVEIEPANVRQDFLIAIAGREFADAAGRIVDAEYKVVSRAGLDEIVDEIFRKFLSTAFLQPARAAESGFPTA